MMNFQIESTSDLARLPELARTAIDTYDRWNRSFDTILNDDFSILESDYITHITLIDAPTSSYDDRLMILILDLNDELHQLTLFAHYDSERPNDIKLLTCLADTTHSEIANNS